MNVLVTGSGGFLGQTCIERLLCSGVVREFDLPDNDVLDRTAVRRASEGLTNCLHLAAHKCAAYGEESPADVAEVNVLGTRNVVERFGPNVVLASTCKAADPMTAYGASKLIAERIVLNAGGRVVRLVNVWGSSGSVAETWCQLPDSDPLPVVDECSRMWMTPMDAVTILTLALQWPAGRYAPAVEPARTMREVAEVIDPGRAIRSIPPRRGDRPVERLVAEYEWSNSWCPGVIKIEHPADVDVPYMRYRSGQLESK